MSIRMEDMAGMDFSDVADVAAGKLPPIHPGEILREDFLLPLGITQYRLAKEIGVSQRRIGEIVHGARHHRGYNASSGGVLRHRCAKLDEPANPLRHRACA